MQLKDFAATLRRRWYLVLVTLLCTAAATFFVVSSVGPTYTATATVLMMPPGTSTQQAGSTGNPLLQLGSLAQARDVIIRVLTSQATSDRLCEVRSDPAYEAMRIELCKPRPGVTFEATPDFTSSAPMVEITVEGNTPANAIVALRAVTEQIPLMLTEIQSDLNLRPRAEITSIPVVVDSLPEVAHKRQIRAGIVGGAGALALGLLLIALLDGFVASRRTVVDSESEEGHDDSPVLGADDTPVWDVGAGEDQGELAEESDTPSDREDSEIRQPQESGRR